MTRFNQLSVKYPKLFEALSLMWSDSTIGRPFAPTSEEKVIGYTDKELQSINDHLCRLSQEEFETVAYGEHEEAKEILSRHGAYCVAEALDDFFGGVNCIFQL